MRVPRGGLPAFRLLKTSMSKSDQHKAREQRLAAKLRENLRRRKVQAKARSGEGGQTHPGTQAPRKPDEGK
jgi:hypothetical protein